MIIIADSREQARYQFQSDKGRYDGVTVEVGTLNTGDYSIKGMESLIGVERKGLSDLIGSISSGRERFEREMERARGYEAFAVVVEATWEDVYKGNYRSRMNPHAACQTIASWAARYRLTWHFAGNRAGAEYFTFSFLHQFLKQKQAQAKAWGVI